MQAQTGSQWAVGDGYERYVGRWSRKVAAKFVDWLAARPALRWLDVGCGTGALAQTVLARARPRVVLGVDPSAGFVRDARANSNGQPARFAIGDARALPCHSGRFDMAVSALAINFVPTPDVAVAEMVRSVRPGGIVAAYVWDYAGEMQFMRRFWSAAAAVDAAAARLDEATRFPLCQPEPLAALFAGAGLAGVETRAIEIPTHFNDFDDFWAPFLGGQGPAPAYCLALPEEKRVRLREALRTTVSAEADGSIRLTARAWAVRGVVPSAG